MSFNDSTTFTPHSSSLIYFELNFVQFCLLAISSTPTGSQKKEKDRVTAKERNESITSLAHDAITILPLLEHGD
ncbi:hypothetical protein P8452_65462 [Trifolium repens]|nr:hypothetical protein P8452_65462 [Trifolium repens]